MDCEEKPDYVAIIREIAPVERYMKAFSNRLGGVAVVVKSEAFVYPVEGGASYWIERKVVLQRKKVVEGEENHCEINIRFEFDSEGSLTDIVESDD